MKFDALIEILHARRAGNQWAAKCPAHEDRSPSLSIAEGRDGGTILFCHAQCTVESICEAAGIKVSDLFSSPRDVQPATPPIVRTVEQKLTGIALRSRMTRNAREAGAVTVVFTTTENLDYAIARALALTVEGEFVQIVVDEELGK